MRGLLPREELLELRSLALDVAAELGWLADHAPRMAAWGKPGVALGAYDDSRWHQFLGEVLQEPAFCELKSHPKLTQTLEAIQGGALDPEHGDLLRVVSSDGEHNATPPHQDQFYVHGEGALWTAWFPLGDCPLSLGALAVLLGSHRAGLRPHNGSGPAKEVVVEAAAEWSAVDLKLGDVLIFGGLTVHRALPNRTEHRLRLSVDYRYRQRDDSAADQQNLG